MIGHYALIFKNVFSSHELTNKKEEETYSETASYYSKTKALVTEDVSAVKSTDCSFKVLSYIPSNYIVVQNH